MKKLFLILFVLFFALEVNGQFCNDFTKNYQFLHCNSQPGANWNNARRTVSSLYTPELNDIDSMFHWYFANGGIPTATTVTINSVTATFTANDTQTHQLLKYGLFDTANYIDIPYLFEIDVQLKSSNIYLTNISTQTDSLLKWSTNGGVTVVTLSVTATYNVPAGSYVIQGYDSVGVGNVSPADPSFLTGISELERMMLLTASMSSIAPMIPAQSYKSITPAHTITARKYCTLFILKLN